MKQHIQHKGYTARAVVDFENYQVVITPVVPEKIYDRLSVRGATVQEVECDFRLAVDKYLAECEEAGEYPVPPTDVLFLSDRASDQFLEAIENPPAPSQELIDLMKPYWGNLWDKHR